MSAAFEVIEGRGAPSAEVVGDVARVRDEAGRVLFEYHAREGRSVVFVPAGDLELRADAGAIKLSARDGVSVATPATLSVEAGVVETRAGRIIESAKNVYREVSELAQMRAGRVRWIAKETFHLLGRTAIIKAEEDVKVKGAKIHLG